MKRLEEWGEIDRPEPPQRSRVSLGEIMGAVALAAVGLKWSPAWVAAVPMIVGIWITAKFDRRTAIRFGSVIVAFYAPTLIGFSLDCSHCREFWLMLWPAIPGGFLFEATRSFLRVARPADPVSAVLSGFTTLALLSGLLKLSLKSRTTWIVVLIVTILYSSFAYFVANMVIRM